MMTGFLDRFRQQDVPAIPWELQGPSQVRAYWEGLRQASALPQRAALDPRGLSGVLDRVFLAEEIGRGLVQIRVAGSALTELAGTDLRGLPLSCLFAPESRPILAQALDKVFVTPAVAEIDLGSDRGPRGIAVARLTLLPLKDEGDCRQLLGVFGLSGGIRPGKLQVLARRSEELVVPEPEPCVPQVAEPVAHQAGQRGHLRLVHFDG
jgi:hypothetical protein